MKDGGPAFPVQHYVNVDGETFQSEPTGMSLRDYFAAAALHGIKWNGYERLDDSAQVCYALADAMLKERDK